MLVMEKTKLFKINDLFKIHSGKRTIHASNVHLSKSKGFPYVVRRSINNGTRNRIDKPVKDTNPANTISFGQDTGTAFYQPVPYFSGRDIKYFTPKKIFTDFNENIALYLVTAIKKSFKLFSWGTSFNIGIIKNVTIKLPVLNGKPDCLYMNKCVGKIKHRYLSSIKEIVTNKKNKIKFNAIHTNFKEIRMNKLFDISKVSSFNKNKLTKGSSYDYITRTINNNGVGEVTGFVDNKHLNEQNVWSLGLLQMTFFYRPRKWYAGQFIRKVIPKFKMNKYLVIYFQSLFDKVSVLLNAEIVSNVDDKFLNMKVKLPFKDNQLDLEYIKNFVIKTESDQLSRLDSIINQLNK